MERLYTEVVTVESGTGILDLNLGSAIYCFHDFVQEVAELLCASFSTAVTGYLTALAFVSADDK